MKVGYARVSSIGQNLESQIEFLKKQLERRYFKRRKVVLRWKIELN